MIVNLFHGISLQYTMQNIVNLHSMEGLQSIVPDIVNLLDISSLQYYIMALHESLQESCQL